MKTFYHFLKLPKGFSKPTDTFAFYICSVGEDIFFTTLIAIFVGVLSLRTLKYTKKKISDLPKCSKLLI